MAIEGVGLMDTVRPSIAAVPRGVPEEAPVALVAVPHWIARVVLVASALVVLLLGAILWRVWSVCPAIAHMDDVVNLKPR